ncbi:MAG: glycosyltransferase family 4 protein [Chloroflexota bacterium]
MADISAIYSVGVKLAGGGYGDTAYHAVRGIARAGYLKKVIALGTGRVELPEEKIRRVRLPVPEGLLFRALPHSLYATIKDAYFDWRAARYVDECHIFHGWANQMSRQAQRARACGARIVTNGASSHPATQVRLVQEEFARYGFAEPVMSARTFTTISRDLETADHIIAASEFVVRSLLDAGIDRRKITLAPFGVDSARFQPGEKRDAVFRVLFIGTVTLRKGIQYLLQAWDELDLRNAELMIVGLITRDAAPVVARYRHRRDIIFRGFVPNPIEAYQQASVFVFPSIEEGSALVTYEAMACGLPVIVSENSGSVARDGVDGFVVPIRDVGALKERIALLDEDVDARRTLGQSARRRVEEFTWEKYGDAVAQVYRRLLKQD